MEIVPIVAEVGGLHFALNVGLPGDTHTWQPLARTPRASCSNISLVVSGRFDVTEKPNTEDWSGVTFSAGVSGDDLPDVEVGKHVYTAGPAGVGHICVHRRGKFFQHQIVRAAAGAQTTLQHGRVLFLGRGDVLANGEALSGPVVIYARTAPVVIQAMTAVLGIVAWK